ncbi:hypothetical protein [Planomicrobium okeanokoites]|uniref:hypothetical protein n=1 Tax=Planomicrobium okeanokoites TaxID=244 RepID=UPI0024927EC2|nr:hypothetical protein [Planomicrobium okeanokoites]
MKKRLTAYKFQLAGRRSITVKVAEFIMIRHILSHGMVKSSIVHDLYRLFVSSKASTSVISNRLAKMREAGILGRIDVPYTYNDKVLNQSFYHAGDRSLIHLHAKKQISETELTRGLLIQQNQKLPDPQSQTMSGVVHRLFQQVEEQGETEVFYTRAELHPIFRKEYESKESLNIFQIWPEWILETDLTVICLIPISSEKQRNYSWWKQVFENDFIKIAKEIQQQGKEFIVFFSVYDGSNHEHGQKNDKEMDGNIGQVKNKMPVPFTWSAHFNVYVLPLKQTVRKLNSLLQLQNFWDESEVPYHTLRDIFPHLNYKGLRYRFLEGPEKERNRVTIHERHYLEVNGEKRLIWMYYAEEGSVKDYFRLTLLNRNFYNQSVSTEGERPDELWIVYETEEEACRDTIWLTNSNNVWLTSSEVWKEISRHNFRFPRMYRMAAWSYYRRRAATYLDDFMEWVEDYSHLYMPTVETKTDFFYEEKYLKMLRRNLNINGFDRKRWIWKPRTNQGLLLADGWGEFRRNDWVQQFFIIQESSFENVVEHTIELMRKLTINPNRFDDLGFKGSDSTKGPLLIVRLNNAKNLSELLNRTAFYSSAMPVLIDGPWKGSDRKSEEAVFYWQQGESIFEWKKENMIQGIYKRFNMTH